MTPADRYRLLLRAYPPAYRAGRGDEIVDTYLELAGGTRRRPSVADATDLVAAGLRERLRARGATGITDALPLAATFTMVAAVVLAGVWLVTVEPRPVPLGIDLRPAGGFQSLGAYVWTAWLLAGAGAALLPGRTARRLVLAALAATVLVLPVAALTPYERPPLLVLVPQAALGVLALCWPARPARSVRVLVAALPAAATAVAVAAVAGGAPLYGYRPTGRDVLAAVAAALVAAAVVTALALTLRRDARGWWALLLVLPPTDLLLVEQVTFAVQGSGRSVQGWWVYAAVAVATVLLASAALPLATLFRNRWQRG
jgi:hypothetical protein